jgi:hypothetical protein
MIVFITTFILFTVEAFLHYNIGHEAKEFVYPTFEEIFSIISTVFIFSILNSFAVKLIEKYFNIF